MTDTSSSVTSPRLLAVLALILIASAILRVYLFSGYEGLDDGEYARFAYLFSQGRPFPNDYAGPAVFPLRVGTYVPAGLVFSVLGVNEWTLVLYPFIASMAAIVLAYFCAAWFFGWRAGLIAAALLGFFYLDIDNATKLLPDLPAAFFAALAMMLVFVMERRADRSRGALFWGGALAGLTFGISWLCKESIAYLVPFCLALIVMDLRRQGVRMVALWAGVAAGSLCVLVTEMVVYQVTTGDLLFRLHEVERNYRQWENGFFTAGSNLGWEAGTTYRDAVIDRLFVSGPRRILFDPAMYFLPAIGLAATAYGWIRRDGAFLVPGIWLWTLVLIFNFGSSSLQSYIPLALYFRYMYLLILPAVVLAAGLLAKTLFAPRGPATASPWIPRIVGVVAALLIVWAAMPQLYFSLRRGSDGWLAEARQLHDDVTPETPLYADTLTLRSLEFFAGYPVKTAWVDLQHVAAPDDIPSGSVVLINRRYIEWLNRNAGMWVAWPAPGPTNRAGYRIDSSLAQPPAGWRQILRTGNARAYKTDARGAASSSPRDAQS